jgi:hypothetical protein
MLGRNEKQLFDKMAQVLSPEDNAQRYRKRLQRTVPPIVPFLGVHLGDLVYLNEAKRKEMSKQEMESACQRESQVCQETVRTTLFLTS